jgi:hypothetical protein
MKGEVTCREKLSHCQIHIWTGPDRIPQEEIKREKMLFSFSLNCGIDSLQAISDDKYTAMFFLP